MNVADRMAKARAAKAAKREALRAAVPAPPPPKKAQGFDIIEMVTSPKYLGDDTISTAQIAILKAIYGLPMTEDERGEFLRMSEGREPKTGGYAETTIIAGTGSGKTDKLAANIAVFEAITFDTSVLAPGEKAIVPVTAQDEDGAQIALGYCEGKLRLLDERGYNVLWRGRGIAGGPKEKEVVGGEIRVRENLSIRVFPCKKASTRGVTAIAAVMDEMAWWRTEPHAYNSDREIQRAIKGRRRAHTRTMRLVKISSPYGEEGVVYEDFEARGNGRNLVLQAPTWVLNPALSRESLLDEELDDPEAFMRERGAQFSKGGGNFISGALVDRCTDKDRPRLMPKVPGFAYQGALDVAFKGDLYAAGVAHLEGGEVVVDGIFWRQGSKRAPLDDEAVNAEAAEFFSSYGVERIIGDQFADVPTKSSFRRNNVEFVSEPQTAQSNHLMFKNLKAAMRRGLLRLPDDPMIRKDLTSLLAKNMPSGLTRVAAPDRVGFHDDISKVLAILTMKLLPMERGADLEKLNSGAVHDRDQLLRLRGFPIPDRDDRLPSNFMEQTF